MTSVGQWTHAAIFRLAAAVGLPDAIEQLNLFCEKVY